MKTIIGYEGKYEGEWDNKRIGKGVQYYDNNDIYLGDFKDDLFDGSGVYLFATGERYEG